MDRFTSRKFIITTGCILGTVALSYFGKMTGDAAIVLAAAIASYNWANSRAANGGS